MTRTRTAATVLLIAVALVCLPLAGAIAYGASSPTQAPRSAQERCTEDMACWDCATMGNGQCGPSGASVATQVDSTVHATVTCTWRNAGTECTWWSLAPTQNAQPASALPVTPRYVG